MKHYPSLLKWGASLKWKHANHQGVRLAGGVNLWMSHAD